MKKTIINFLRDERFDTVWLAIYTFLLVITVIIVAVPAHGEQALSDGSGRANALSILGCNDATCTVTTRVAANPVTHALKVEFSSSSASITPMTIFDYDCHDIGPATGSGADFCASGALATATMMDLVVTPTSSSTLRIRLDGVAPVAGVGLACKACTYHVENTFMNCAGIFNEGPATASVCVSWAGVLP
jgi:hypothetical protein